MRAALSGFLGVVSLFALAACGGGGGGGGATPNTGGGGGSGGTPRTSYSISLSATSFEFSGAQFEEIPNQTITATFNGDGVLVSTLPGESLARWLNVTPDTKTSTTANLQISVSTQELEPGVHSQTLRFYTGRADGSDYAYRDIVVTLSLKEGFALAEQAFAFMGVEGGTASPSSQTLQIRGEDIAWTVTEKPSWLTFSAMSGTSRTSLTLTPTLAELSSARYQGTIRIVDSVSGRSAIAFASLEVLLPSPTLSETQFAISIDAATQASALRRTFVISDTAAGANVDRAFAWEITASDPLLVVSPSSGSTANGPITVTVDLDPNAVHALPSGQHNEYLTLKFNGQEYFGLLVRFDIGMRLPRAGSASPYLIEAGTAASTTVIGEDFRDEDIDRLRLNDQPISSYPGASVTRLDAQRLQLSLPAGPPREIDLSFTNALNLSRSTATIKFYTASSAGPGVIVSAGNRTELHYDEARTRIYAVDGNDDEIERYAWNGTQWTTLSAISLPGLTDAVPMRDGRRLVASAQGGYWSINLDTGTATVLNSVPQLDCPPGSSVALAATEFGTLFGSAGDYTCTFVPDVNEYDPLGDRLEPVRTPTYTEWMFPAASLATTRDGRYVAIGGLTTTGGHFGVFDMRTRTFVERGDSSRFSTLYYYRIDLSDAATMFLINNDTVRDRAGVVFGRLPANATARLSADGTRAFVYVHGAGGTGYLRVLNVSTPVGNSAFPQIGADIPVSADLGTPLDIYGNVTSFGMVMTDDERLAVIAGSSRIAIVAVP